VCCKIDAILDKISETPHCFAFLLGLSYEQEFHTVARFARIITRVSGSFFGLCPKKEPPLSLFASEVSKKNFYKDALNFFKAEGRERAKISLRRT
jgi:hypothetical protein